VSDVQRHDATRAAGLALAAAVRAACVQAAIEGFEDARIAGLCCEGAIEAAVEAMRKIDMERIVREQM
jgi:hypothetical protein